MWSNTIRARQPLEKLCVLDDGVAEHMDLDVPAEIVDALRQRLEHVDGGRAGLDEIEADAANAEVVQPLEFGIGDAGVDHRHAMRAWAQPPHRVEGAGIVGPVGRGRDDDVARRAEPLLKPAIVVDGRVLRSQLGVGSDRKAAVVNVHVTVARVRRRLELWRLRSRRPGHGLRMSGRCVQSACHDEGRSHGFEKASAGSGAAHVYPPHGRTGDPPADAIRLRQSRAASKSRTRGGRASGECGNLEALSSHAGAISEASLRRRGVDGRDNPRIKSGDGHDDRDHAAPARADSRSKPTSASRLSESRKTEATASVRPARRMRTRPSLAPMSPSTTRSSHFSAWPT